MNDKIKMIINIVGFYIGWWGCILFIKWPALHWANINVIIYHISWCFFCKGL